MTDGDPASTGRNRDGTFAPGNSINPRGRPRGSRNKLGAAFFDDLYSEWLQHGSEVIARVREEQPAVFLKVVASTLPWDNENAAPGWKRWIGPTFRAARSWTWPRRSNIPSSCTGR